MLNILIVDDSLIMRKQIATVMVELGHTVVAQAKNNEEAISAHSRFRIDLVTMDITMPGIDGIDTTKDLLAKDPDTKIVMVTSHGQEAMVVDSIRAGALGYILKPVTEKAVKEVIEKIFKIS